MFQRNKFEVFRQGRCRGIPVKMVPLIVAVVDHVNEVLVPMRPRWWSL